MTGPTHTVPKLFEQRMRVIGQLSQETAKHLQILQRLNGHKVLSMKDPDTVETTADQQDSEAELDACQQRIDAMELDLRRIDTEIAAAQKEENDG